VSALNRSLKKMRRRKIILIGVAAVLLGGWFVAPRAAVWSMALATKKGEESSQRARDRIVFFGERAIQPTISSIEEHSPWVRRYCYLPSALEKIGGSARSDLLAAIGVQNDPMKRVYLISALQTAFEDYSQFDTVIDDFETGRLSDGGLFHMASYMRHSFPDAPELLTEDRKLNPEFKAFWKKRSEQDGAGQPATRSESK
jgi:hypothetical protein